MRFNNATVNMYDYHFIMGHSFEIGLIFCIKLIFYEEKKYAAHYRPSIHENNIFCCQVNKIPLAWTCSFPALHDFSPPFFGFMSDWQSNFSQLTTTMDFFKLNIAMNL